MDCLFCKIVNKEVESTIVFEDENVLAFKDIYPKAKIHILFIPKKHSCDVNAIDPDDVNHIFKAITSYTKKENLDKEGFRIVNNMGEFGCQTFFHTHFHLLAGEQLGGYT
jgi:histidine triad (HIT) family protein